MTTLQTSRLLGTLRTEHIAHYESEGAGSRGRNDYRPVQTPVLNDGRWHYWMQPGEDYEVGYDGTGWRVTCRTWSSAAAAHVYRLASAATWAHVHRLPIDDGEAVLESGRTYILSSVGHGAWTMHEA